MNTRKIFCHSRRVLPITTRSKSEVQESMHFQVGLEAKEDRTASICAGSTCSSFTATARLLIRGGRRVWDLLWFPGAWISAKRNSGGSRFFPREEKNLVFGVGKSSSFRFQIMIFHQIFQDFQKKRGRFFPNLRKSHISR